MKLRNASIPLINNKANAFSAPAPENRLLLFTALACSENAHIDGTIRSMIPDISDWDHVARLLIHHGTLKTFIDHLERLEVMHSVPTSLKEQLLGTSLMLRYRNNRFFEEMIKIADVFHHQNVGVVFIKGAMLTLSGYYDAESRFMEDIDCIVKPAFAESARALLLGMGYSEPDEQKQSTQLHFRGEMEFFNSNDHELKVEISLKLNKNYELARCYPFRDEELQGKLVEKVANGVRFQEIEKEYHFVYCLFHHVALNYLHRLNWLNDLYLMTCDEEVDWRKIESYLDAYGLRKSWALLQNIFYHHFHMQFGPTSQGTSGPLKALFLSNDCRFVDLEVIEQNNVSVRFQLIDSVWHKISVVIRKIVLPPEWLRLYYGLDSRASVLRIYFVHFTDSLKRFLKIRTRHGNHND